jgi:hypothetical protein
MMEDTRRLFKTVTAVLVVLAALCILSLVKSALDLMSSGTLAVSTPNDDSIITVSRENASASIIGTGDTRVRLIPGTYLVGVGREGRVSTKAVVISKGETSDVNLSATSTALLPASANINFQGTDALKDHGFTDSQISAIRRAIFDFKHDAKRAAIDTNSITSPPLDRNRTSIGFSKTFSLVIDGTAYHATVSWSDPNTATLALADQTGAIVFDNANGHD